MRISSVAALLPYSLVAAMPAAIPHGPHLKKRFTGPSDPARFTFYDTPTPGVICDGDTGPDGETLWYQDLVAPIMGVFNYKTKQIQEFQIPYSSQQQSTAPMLGNVTGLQCVVRTGKDNMVYGGAGIRNEIVQVNPYSNPPHLQVFSPPVENLIGNLQPFNDAWAANQGLFFSQTTAGIVSLFDYKTHIFTEYPVPSRLSGPLGMRTDKYNNLWFTNFQGQFISRLDNVTGAITEYHNCCPLPQGSFPEVLRSSTQNQKYLWANAFGGGGYIRIEPEQTNPNQIFKIFTNPTGAGTFPFENDNDFCGRIWYTSPLFDILVYYTPSTNKWTTVQIPPLTSNNGGVPGAGNFEVIMHRGPGHFMYFSIGSLGKIGQYELDPTCEGSAQ